MKIVHIITALGFGGAEKLLVNLTSLQVLSHQVAIIYLKDETGLKPLLHPDITCHYVPIGTSTARKLRQKLKEIMPDVVHTHLGHADLLGLWACRNLPVKLFCTMHNIWFKWNWKDRIIFKTYTFLLNTVASHCKVICISGVVADHVRRRLSVPESRIHLMYNAIPRSNYDKSRNEARQDLNISASSFCLLFVGRLSLQKSVDTLLRAAALVRPEVPNLKVLIVGEGGLRPELERLCHALQLNEVVEFRGTTFFPDQYFVSADVFVLPSLFEGMGIVLLEAFRAGLPIVASNVEGPKELVKDRETGLLFEPKQPQQLAALIKKLYEDENLRSRLGRKGKDEFENKFEMEQYVKQVEALYFS